MSIVESKPDMNIGIWAEGGNVENPSSEKIEEGWVIEKPLNEYMNWVQNRQDKMLQYLNQRGVSEWDARTEYPIHAYVARAGTLYQALSQNTDRDPTLNQAIWKIAFVGYDEFVTYADDIKNMKDTDGFLKYYVKKSDPVMEGETKGVSYNNLANTSGYSFKLDLPTVKYNGNVVAEFSGGTNHKDVVTHEQLMQAIQMFKVGAVYTSVRPENPFEILGYGTWERFAEGRTLVGFSTSISNSVPEWVKTQGGTFGEYEHKLTVDEMPSHDHDISVFNDKNGHDSSDEGDRGVRSKSTILRDVVLPSGGDKPHNNVQPSIVVYFWKRVA
mgnify:CR=1 FL=1